MLLVLLLQGEPDVVVAAAVWSTRFFPHYMMSTYLNNRPQLAAAMMYCLMIRCESWNCTG
jgi:hypothetical protein